MKINVVRDKSKSKQIEDDYLNSNFDPKLINQQIQNDNMSIKSKNTQKFNRQPKF